MAPWVQRIFLAYTPKNLSNDHKVVIPTFDYLDACEESCRTLSIDSTSAAGPFLRGKPKP